MINDTLVQAEGDCTLRPVMYYPNQRESMLGSIVYYSNSKESARISDVSQSGWGECWYQ